MISGIINVEVVLSLSKYTGFADVMNNICKFDIISICRKL